MAILQDASAPAAVDVQATTGGTIATASFSPPANSMVVIVASVGYFASASAPTVTCTDSNAVSYTAGPAVFDTLFEGVYIFTHFYSSAPGAITVTVTRTVALGQAMLEIVPYVLTGAASVQTGAASLTFSTTSNVSAFNRSFTPTTPGSWSIIGAAIGNQMSGSPTAVNVSTDHSSTDGTDFVSAAAGHAVTGTPAAANMGWTWGGNADYAWAALEILPAAGAATPALADRAGAADKLTAAVAVTLADTAGAADAVTTGTGALTPGEAETASAAETLAIAISQASAMGDRAGAADAITVTIGGAPTPTPGTSVKAASPAFIRSQMPRMHVQNLLTGQWLSRDVQGVVSPSITWALNTADAFTCALSPPRAEMLDASGNALLMEWRDAIYLEESDEIKFGGIVTQSTITGPVWNITAMGFAGYPNGMPYEGPDLKRTNYDALDAVRYIWDWLQTQPGGNISMELGTQKAGVLLGAQIVPGITSEVARVANVGDKSIWVGNAQAFNGNMTVTITGQPYTIAGVVRTSENLATGQINLTTPLKEPHQIHDAMTQTSPVFTRLAHPAKAGDNNIWLGEAGPFASGEIIVINGNDQYTVGQVNTDTKGGVTGNITITPNIRKAYPVQTTVVQVRTITPFELHWYNSTDLGGEITSIQQEAIFDFREHHYWGDPNRATVRHQLLFGVPRVGTRLTGLRFAEGENIVQAVTVTRDGTKYASNVIALGAGSGSYQVRTTASSPNTGRLRRTYVFTDQTVATVARAASKAQAVLTSMANIDAVSSVVVKNHPNAPFGSFAPGDDIPVMMASGWRNTTIWSRIVSMTQDPTTDLMTLTVARSDSFTYMAQTGQAGTL